MKKQLIKELKEMMKQGKGYLTVRDFIKDFELTNGRIVTGKQIGRAHV